MVINYFKRICYVGNTQRSTQIKKILTNEQKTKLSLAIIITENAMYFRLTDNVSFNRKGINVTVGSNLGSYAQNDDINNINLGK